MHPIVQEFVDFIVNECPRHNKEQAAEEARTRFHLIQDRNIFYCEHFAARFSYSREGAFSNTVLSLSALQKYDHIPVFVILVKGNGDNELFLANSTFIKKISHSSKELRMDNIRGSFNGTDIMREYRGLQNNAANYQALFAFHSGLSWEDNLERLVFTSAGIEGSKTKYDPGMLGLDHIYNSVNRAIDFVCSQNYNVLLNDLNGRVEACKTEIMIASHIENVNLRGNLIETLIAADEEELKQLKANIKRIEQAMPAFGRKHALGDYQCTFDNGKTLTDIKTKIIYLDSNPKAYNVDKFLEAMSEDNTVFFFYFVGIDENDIMNTILCSVFHKKLLASTHVQHHWAGRNSRGVTQFVGKDIDDMLREKSFKNEIDKAQSKKFLDDLLAL